MSYSIRFLPLVLVLAVVPQTEHPSPHPEVSAQANREAVSAPAFGLPHKAVPAGAELESAVVASEVVVPGVSSGESEARSAVRWVVGVFEKAGLRIPPIEVSIHEDDEPCGGFEGVFRPRGTPLGIDICNPHRLIILHEFVHAWEHTTLTDPEREAYMELRGLHSWNSGSVAWKDRGIEDLASVVAWGLLRLDRSERPSDLDDRGGAFTLVTGIDLSAIEAPGSEASAIPGAEAVDREPDWDLVH